MGHLTTLFNDQYGRYFTEASQYQKEQNQKKSESTDEEAQTTVAPPPAAPAPPPAAPPINPDLLAAVRRPANRPLRRVNSNPDLHSAEREEWKPLSIQDIMAQRDRILAEKRSDQEREPEVGTPVKGELTDVLSRRMNEVRARVTLSPQKPPSQTPKHMVGAGATPTRLSKGMAPKDDTPRTKYLARKEGAKGRPPTSWGGAGESSSEESEDSHDWS
ncbi:MAG: hypothetical protein KFB93_02015 [Simkaniaceae bacterium]|nr:MAG: hypothetical protein KFB93_02015 [Simkaniaceae bacterium]